MADRYDDEAFAGLVRNLESEMATRTRSLRRPHPLLAALVAGALGAPVVVGVLDLSGRPALYVSAIVASLALLLGLVRLVVFEWLTELPEVDQRRSP